MSDRLTKAAEAQRLRGEGLLLREIAERIGVAKSTVSAWLCDPDGSKLRARKDSYRGECIDCGGPTSGGDGPNNQPKRCVPCHNKTKIIWTRENLIASVHEWVRRYGFVPTSHDWNLGRPTDEQRERYLHDGCWPPSSAIWRVFGGWRPLIEAAGFEVYGPWERAKQVAA